MVVVTKSNFIEQSNDLLDHLPTAAFIALDEEMTGISVPSSSPKQRRVPPKDETPSQQWSELKKAPETYSIIQLGIALFHYTGKCSNGGAASNGPPMNGGDSDDWTVRRYNFFVFPGKDSDRSVVLNPAAVAFLHQHDISFDKWTKEGIPFQAQAQAQETLRNYLKKEIAQIEAKEKQEASSSNSQKQPQQPTVQEVSRKRVQLRRTEDIDFFSCTMASVRQWMDAPIAADQRHLPLPTNGNEALAVDSAAEGASFLLPECNAFLRRALYESIEQEYPSLILEKVPGVQRIRVWRLSDEERERRDERLRQEAWQNILVEQVGLYRVFHALSLATKGFAIERDTPLLAASMDDIDWQKEYSLYRGAKHRKIPLVVHNGFMDLCFLLSHFVMPNNTGLPETLPECKSLIRKFFPTVYDTKILALECSTQHSNENTRLGALFDRVKNQVDGRVRVLTSSAGSPKKPPPANGGTNGHAAPKAEDHFADYDAYMTGVCYLGICQSILRQGSRSLVAQPQVGTLSHLLEPVWDAEVRKRFGRNLLYQMSIYSLDLETEDFDGDPLCRGMSKEATLRVSSIDPSITTRDIVQSVSGLRDAMHRSVPFEIIWVDDTTFMVAATYTATTSNARSHTRLSNGGGGLTIESPDQETLEETLQSHGQLLSDALQRRFSDCTVVMLGDHLRRLEEEREAAEEAAELAQRPSMAKRLWNWMGLPGSCTASATTAPPKSPMAQEQPLLKKRKLVH